MLMYRSDIYVEIFYLYILCKQSKTNRSATRMITCWQMTMLICCIFKSSVFSCVYLGRNALQNGHVWSTARFISDTKKGIRFALVLNIHINKSYNIYAYRSNIKAALLEIQIRYYTIFVMVSHCTKDWCIIKIVPLPNYN
jgi:hypothetical protein